MDLATRDGFEQAAALIEKGLLVRLVETRKGRSGRDQHVLVSWDNVYDRETV